MEIACKYKYFFFPYCEFNVIMGGGGVGLISCDLGSGPAIDAII